tara:strand:+ start:2547 stop:3008 length:462 start_codon:yes stop_codon:yes gene_type:complete
MSISDLNEKLKEDLKSAMRSGQKNRLETIRSIITALKTAESAPNRRNKLEDLEIILLLQRLKKQRIESIEIFESQNRKDLAQAEKEQLLIILEYLPPLMSKDELTSTLKDMTFQLKANTPNDFGRVMAHASKSLVGKAEGQLISRILKEILNS